MKNINIDNRDNVIQAAKDLLESGTLWINLEGEEYYIPDFINDITEMEDDDQGNF